MAGQLQRVTAVALAGGAELCLNMLLNTMIDIYHFQSKASIILGRSFSTLV
jgi:hypothetical protein